MKPFLKIANLELKTPLMLASGTWGFGENLLKYLSIEEIRDSIGALVTKGISLYPRPGNPPPRILEVSCGIINSIGLENPGLEVFRKTYLPKILSYQVPVIVNVHGESVEEIKEVIGNLREEEIQGIELNISCPNVKKGGIAFSSDPKTVKKLVREIRNLWDRYLAVKLSPVGYVYEISKICEDEGADALVVANTYPALGVVNLNPPRFIKGGLSGPAIKPLTLRLVYELSQKVNIPIIGCGGINSGRDAIEYLICGAKAVQIGTANLINPRSAVEIISEMRKLREEI